MEKMKLNTDDLQMWEHHPITQLMFKALKDIKEDYKSDLDGIIYQSSKDHKQAAIAVNCLITRNRVLDKILDITNLDNFKFSILESYVDLEQEKDNAQGHIFESTRSSG